MQLWGKRSLQLTLCLLLLAISVTATQANQTANARIRFVHTVVGGTNVDLRVDNGLVFQDIGFRIATSYQSLPAGNRTIRFFRAGTNDDGGRLFEATYVFSPGQDYTVIAYGRDNNFTGIQFTDNNNLPPAGKTNIRVIHASPDAPTANICITGSSACLYEGLPQTGATNRYIQLDPGTYSFDFREGGSNRAITLPALNFENQKVHTLFVIGLIQGNPQLQAINITDAAPGQAPPPPPTKVPNNGAFLTPTMAALLMGILFILLGSGWLIWKQIMRWKRYQQQDQSIV